LDVKGPKEVKAVFPYALVVAGELSYKAAEMEDREKLKKWKFMLDSMTKKELEDPDLLDGNRIERIAKGAGVSVSEVRELIKQYKQSKKVMKLMKGKNPERLMQKFMGGKMKIK